MFSELLDNTLNWISPIARNYGRFVGAVICSAKATIPGGYWKKNVPGWNEVCEELYAEFLESWEREVANELLHNLDTSRRQKWMKKPWVHTIKPSSMFSIAKDRRSQSFGNQRSYNLPKWSGRPHRIHIKSSSRPSTHHQCEKGIGNSKRYQLLSAVRVIGTYSYWRNYTLKETKPSKEAGFDGINPEFLIHSGPYTKQWLA